MMKDYILEIKKIIPESFCKKIISYFDNSLYEPGTVSGKDKSVRNCDARNMQHTNTFGEKICSNYVLKKIFDCKDLYATKFSYLHCKKISSCELLKYEHNQYKAGYKFHTDMGFSVSERQISVSICLNNEFSGGEFVFDLRCTRYGGVIHDLRKKGWRIENINEGNSKFTFRLTKQPIAYGLGLAYKTMIQKEGSNV